MVPYDWLLLWPGHHALSRAPHSALPSLHPGTGGATALLGKCGIWTGEQCTVGIQQVDYVVDLLDDQLKLKVHDKQKFYDTKNSWMICSVQWHFWNMLLHRKSAHFCPFQLDFDFEYV